MPGLWPWVAWLMDALLLAQLGWSLQTLVWALLDWPTDGGWMALVALLAVLLALRWHMAPHKRPSPGALLLGLNPYNPWRKLPAYRWLLIASLAVSVFAHAAWFSPALAEPQHALQAMAVVAALWAGAWFFGSSAPSLNVLTNAGLFLLSDLGPLAPGAVFPLRLVCLGLMLMWTWLLLRYRIWRSF